MFCFYNLTIFISLYQYDYFIFHDRFYVLFLVGYGHPYVFRRVHQCGLTENIAGSEHGCPTGTAAGSIGTTLR